MNILAKGIDVSTFQGDINWQAVKDSGVEFAILRSGFGSPSPSQVDDKFYQNVQGCQVNNIPMGAYHYGYAVSVEEARNEAQFFLDIIKGISFDYPLWYDVEDNGTMGKLGKQELTDVINAFCEVIANAGYKIGVYANVNWLENKMCVDQIDYPIWVAQYYDECQYNGNYQIWQYTSKGHVEGIYSSGLDMDYCYVNYIENVPTEPREAPQEQPASMSPFVATGICREGLIDAHAENSDDSPVLFQLARGNCVNIYGNTENSWYNINCLHGNAYVHTQDIHVNGDDSDGYVEDDVEGSNGECENNSQNQYNTYTVVSGDSMWQISKQFDISIGELISANPQIEDINLISIGQEINIPQ